MPRVTLILYHVSSQSRWHVSSQCLNINLVHIFVILITFQSIYF